MIFHEIGWNPMEIGDFAIFRATCSEPYIILANSIDIYSPAGAKNRDFHDNSTILVIFMKNTPNWWFLEENALFGCRGSQKWLKNDRFFVCFVTGALRDGKKLIFMKIRDFDQISRNFTHFHENLWFFNFRVHPLPTLHIPCQFQWFLEARGGSKRAKPLKLWVFMKIP